jgi:hypothetical protein
MLAVLTGGMAFASAGTAEASVRTISADSFITGDLIGGVCDGDPNLEYAPTGTRAGQMAEGVCRQVIDATGRAVAAVGNTAKECAEATLFGAGVDVVTGSGSLWSRAKKLAKKVPKKAFAVAATADCAYDIVY